MVNCKIINLLCFPRAALVGISIHRLRMLVMLYVGDLILGR